MLKKTVVSLFYIFLLLSPLAAREAEEESREAVEPVKSDAPLSIDWENPQVTLRSILDELLTVSGYMEPVELVYFKDYRFVDDLEGSSDSGVLLAYYSPRHSRNTAGMVAIAVGFAVFEVARTPDELAWLLAHEVIHVAAHHEERYRDFKVSELLAWYKTKDKDFVGQLNPSQARALFESERQNQLSNFRRQLEFEADKEAFNLMALAGFNPQIEKKALQHMDDLAQALDLKALDESTGKIYGSKKKSSKSSPRTSKKR